MSGFSAPPNDDNSWNLVPLTPEYLHEEHGGYVRAIDAALAEPKIKNIALSGNYGVGKSSILQQVAENHADKVVEISLSTLAPKVDDDVDDTIPKQATTTTNRIQQEIVKQLLYREEPQKLTGSRFRRIESFYWPREIGIAGALGFVIAVIFLLTGWTNTISNTLIPWIFIGLYDHLAILVIAALSVISFRRLFHGRLRITQLSAGAATVTLDEKSMSYFDQYLDEIVHFFDVSKRTIVIFEDIDRFDDPHIFETLRALNTLLNASRSGEKTIRFIYAIKDSIFDTDRLNLLDDKENAKSEPAYAEIVRANRTKFFDLVIPVVPFITHRSAKSLVYRLLKDLKHDVDPELLDLASRYVPDMRLLKNIRNEFIVFRERIFSGDGKDLQLTQTELFAIMLYKSTHLADFEAIRLGKSNLDTLYNVYRHLVASNLEKLKNGVAENRKLLHQYNDTTARSLKLRDKFIALCKRSVRFAGYNYSNSRFVYGGRVLSEQELGNTEFWKKFVSSEEDSRITWNNPHYSGSLNFEREDLAEAFGISLEPYKWDENYRNELKVQIDENMYDIDFVRRADMGDFINRNDFEVEYLGSPRTFSSIAIEVLRDGLAYQLVRAGFINRNFTLYTSTFHKDRVGPAAQNFIIHNVERNVMDEHFQLTPEDVEAVLRECGDSALKDHALYNLDILNYLLKFKSHKARTIISSLKSDGAEQKHFMETYLLSGKRTARFAQHLSYIFSDVFIYLIAETELSDKKIRRLINIVLSNLNGNVKYKTGSVVEKYITENYSFFSVLKHENIRQKTIKKIAEFFSNLGVCVERLDSLSSTCRNEFISFNIYAINRENIELVFENQISYALDVAFDLDRTVYRYLLQNLQDYLVAVDGLSETICSTTRFIQIVEDVLASHPSLLEPVIANSSEDCLIDHIDQISSDTWPLLAKCNRIKPTFANINRYLEEIGKVDSNLSKVLESASNVLEIDSISDEEKQSLAAKILAAKDTLQSVQLRVSLVNSLNLGRYLVVEDLPLEDGELFSELLKADLIADEIETFARIAEASWRTRELYINESKWFSTYVNGDLLNNSIGQFLTSVSINRETKIAILNRLSEFEEYGFEKEGLYQIASFAVKNGIAIPYSIVLDMAKHGVQAELVISLLEPHLNSMSKSELFTVLKPLKGSYAWLTSVGYGIEKFKDTSENRALLNKLKRLGIVSSFPHDAGFLKVSKKRK